LKALTSLPYLLEQTRVLKLMQGDISKKRKCHFDRQLRSRENPYCNCARLRGLSAGYEGQILYGSCLINELLAAQQEYRLNKLEKQWLAPHLVILDD